MFDLIKEIYYERKGYDIEAYREQQELQRKLKEKRIINTIVVLFLAFFFVIALFSIKISINNGDILNTIKYIVLGLLEIAIVLLHFLKKKKFCYACGGSFLVIALLSFMI